MAALLRFRVRALLGRSRLNSVNVTNRKTSLADLTVRSVASSNNKNTTPSLFGKQEKTEFEIELAKVKKKEKYKQFYGFYEDEPVMDRFLFHCLMFTCVSVAFVFIPIMLFYSPDVGNKRLQWKRREAYLEIERRKREGLPMIDCNYCPAELMENMIQPPGDWEAEWLQEQPTTKPSSSYWYAQYFP